MKFGIIVFPGSNCDHDCYNMVKHVLGKPASFIWHKEEDLSGVDVVLLPGGFSYGDYLRAGAIARFSPVMRSVEKFAKEGGLVLGICNGFQILLEAGLLPGTMLRNRSLKFICRDVYLRVDNINTPFTLDYFENQIIRMPIAHAEGNYYTD
ncbi:MAG: phosphoribosylformylglycinamidine synthase subunit PurQ, partial [Nitrospira sp.]|nr:phosphoribosylformylglycinamidine synthase subunit PurQ [Nitrospira sp.]